MSLRVLVAKLGADKARRIAELGHVHGPYQHAFDAAGLRHYHGQDVYDTVTGQVGKVVGGGVTNVKAESPGS